MIEDPDELAVIRTLRDPASLGWRRGCGVRALSALCSRHRPPWRLDGVTWFVDMKPRQLEWLTSTGSWGRIRKGCRLECARVAFASLF